MTTAVEIAHKAKEELVRLTGLEADTVSAIKRDTKGWWVTVSMIELKRIPEATDLLGSYEAILDDEGELVSYRRTRRYLREQITEEEQ